MYRLQVDRNCTDQRTRS